MRFSSTPNEVVKSARLGVHSYTTDLENRYHTLFTKRSGHISLMEPSPGATRIDLTYYTDGPRLHYDTVIKLTPEGRKLWKELPPLQRNHRSRDIAVAWFKLCSAELYRRVEKYHELKRYIDKVRIPDRLSHAISNIILEKTYEYMTIDWDWFKKYANEHWRSSILPGYKWANFYMDSESSDIHELYDTLRHNLQTMYDHGNLYNDVEFNVGIRARSLGLEGANYTGETVTTSQDVDRSRIIQFHPSMNMYTAFIPDKVRWYADMYDEIESYLDLSADVFLPHLMGGAIYPIADALHGTGLKYHALDARSWDSINLDVLGNYSNVFATIVAGTKQLCSGETWTSLIGTVATLVVAQNCPGMQYAIILGDDIGSWGAKSWPSLMEEDKNDTNLKYLLGLSFMENRARIVGLRFSTDRASKMQSARINSGGVNDTFVERPYDPEVSKRWYDLYHGTINDNEILDVFTGIPGRVYTHPGDIMESLIETGKVGNVTDYVVLGPYRALGNYSSN